MSPKDLALAATRFDNGLRYRDGVHPGQDHLTPGYVLDCVRADLDLIYLDPCTTDDNPVRAHEFYTPREDGLRQEWRAPVGGIFVNPPYGKAREPWVRKCIEAGSRGLRVVLLIPAATDTRIFREAAETSTAVVFVSGRLKFGVLRPNRRQRAASHPSALVGWNTHLWQCSNLGWRARAVA